MNNYTVQYKVNNTESKEIMFSAHNTDHLADQLIFFIKTYADNNEIQINVKSINREG